MRGERGYILDFRHKILDFRGNCRKPGKCFPRGKTRSNKMTNKKITQCYKDALKNGALGGKIVGAGGGGFLMFYSDDNEKLRQKIKRISQHLDVELPDQRREYTQRFKGISSRILREFDAFTCNDSRLLNYLCIPIVQRGVLQFIEGRYMLDSKNKPKSLRK